MRELRGILLLRQKDRFYTSPQPCPVASRDIALKSKQEQKAKTIQQKGIDLLLCARMCDRGGVRKDGGVENNPSSAGLYWTFNPLARRALPLYRCAAQGERFKSVASNILNSSIAVSRSFMGYFCFTIGDI